PGIAALMAERHEKYERMGEAFDEIDREIKKQSPDRSLIKNHAAQINSWANQQLYWFPEGSGPESGLDTEAKADIWTRPDEFSALQHEFIREAAKLNEAASSADHAHLAERIEATGAVCSQCHEVFRKQFSLFSIFGF
ncbi:MAG: cytochrome c, partial [Rhodospirillaceae bacterium]